MSRPTGTTAASLAYRPDIDGLRAIAVLAVVFGHAGLPGFAGGFVGVDIFFVISGFLIHSILRREMDEGRFQLSVFYERRARRILPALFAMLLVSTLGAWVLMVPSESTDFGLSQLSVLLFLSNAYFWDVTGYFSPDTLRLPLIHTWSLAVEEQYYLLFPLLFLGIRRVTRRRGIAAVLAMFAMASFALCLWGAANKPEVNYYFPFSRFWELLAGALCSYLRPRLPPRFAGAGAAAGLVLVLGSVAFLTAALPYPSALTLPPVLGAALLLVCGGNGTLTDRLLGLGPVVGIGLVSYSLYLWHQPVFAYARIAGIATDDLPVAAGLILLAMALAAASWRWIEEPFRKPGRLKSGLAPRAALGSFAALFAAGAVLAFTEAHLRSFRPEDRPMLAMTRHDAERFMHARGEVVRGADFANDGRLKILVVGDSYGKDFINALALTPLWDRASLSFHQISWRCAAFMLPPDTPGFPPTPFPRDCDGVDRYQSPDLLGRLAEADVVVLASSWQMWQMPFFSPSLANIGAATTGKVVLFGTKTLGFPDLKQALATPSAQRGALRVPPTSEEVEINARMKALGLPGFVDMQSLLCPDAAGCPVVGPAGELMTLDGYHLTPEGARHLARRMEETGLLDSLCGKSVPEGGCGDPG